MDEIQAKINSLKKKNDVPLAELMSLLQAENRLAQKTLVESDCSDSPRLRKKSSLLSDGPSDPKLMCQSSGAKKGNDSFLSGCIYDQNDKEF